MYSPSFYGSLNVENNGNCPLFWVLIKFISLYLLMFVIARLLAHDMLASVAYA